MASLTSANLKSIQNYINSAGAAKNPISLVMELGQLVHVSPVFNCYEPRDVSSVHQHVFVCEVQFANLTEKSQGYNKKRVKTEAAEKLVTLLQRKCEAIHNAQGRPVPQTRSRVTTASLQTRGVLFQRDITSGSAASQIQQNSAEFIGNAVGKLQEYTMSKCMGFPEYTQKEESFEGCPLQFTATVKIPGQSVSYSGIGHNKAEAKQSAAHKMLKALTEAEGRVSDKVQSSEDRFSIRTMRNYLSNIQYTAHEAASSKGADQEFTAFVDAFENIKLNQSDDMKSKVTSVERLNKIARLEKFDIIYHDVTSSDNSYLCLLQVKINTNLVCHGIGENQPQARESAAENMLQIIKFFKQFETGKE